MFYVYDIECMSNYFLACFLNVETGERKSFEISDYQDDLGSLKSFLKDYGLILGGYNVLDYDSQLLEFIMSRKSVSCYDLYNYSQKVIDSDFPDVPEWQLRIPHIDVFKVNHWNNPAKRSGLKWLQFSMDWHNIEDMPLPHTHWVKENERELIEDYCWNDVTSTLEVFKLSKEQIKVRQQLTKEFNVNMINSPEPTISKKIIGSLLSKQMGISTKELRSLRTYRTNINLKDCILPIVKFNDPILQSVQQEFERTTIVNTKKAFNISKTFKGIQLEYGLGGIHAAVQGVHKSDNDYIIKSADVTSFYPMLAINYGFKPEHLPESFSKLYYWFFTERKKYPKSNPLNYVFKLILNSSFGLSSDENSFLYDPLMTMQITVNGQLLLSMLIEEISNIPNCKILMANTDGFEVKMPRKYESLYDDVCRRWCNLTNLNLEFVDYKHMFVENVNNYIAEDVDTGYVKCKGRFEFEDLKKKKVSSLHKNKSALIIPIAVHNYFIKNIPIEETIQKHSDIFDFCIGMRSKADSHFEYRGVAEGRVFKTKLSKTIRYFISNSGGSLYKLYNDGREQTVNVHPQKGKTWHQKVVNQLSKEDTHYLKDVNMNYYIAEAKKIVENIESSQLKLF